MERRPPAGTGNSEYQRAIFARVNDVATSLALPGVEAAVKYDGSPVLKADGAFMAGLATHPSAEPGSLVVRTTLEEREGLLSDAPATYYITDYYRPHRVVLVRLSKLDREALRDLLRVSWRLTTARTRKLRTPYNDDPARP